MELTKMSNEELIRLLINAVTVDGSIIRIEAELLSRLEAGEKYRQFFESCLCHFAEGVEFMTKAEIYEAIKREVKKIEGGAE